MKGERALHRALRRGVLYQGIDMHNYIYEDQREPNMWKRYEQIFNLNKYKADQRLLDQYFADDTIVQQ